MKLQSEPEELASSQGTGVQGGTDDGPQVQAPSAEPRPQEHSPRGSEGQGARGRGTSVTTVPEAGQEAAPGHPEAGRETRSRCHEAELRTQEALQEGAGGCALGGGGSFSPVGLRWGGGRGQGGSPWAFLSRCVGHCSVH